MSKKNRLNDRLMQLHNDQEDFSRQDKSSVIDSIRDNIIDLGSDQNDEYEDETGISAEIIENIDNDFIDKKSKVSYRPAQRGIFTTGALPYRCMRNAIYILGDVQTSICNWIRRITIKGILKATLITFVLLLCINRMPSLIYNTFLSGKYNGEELIFDNNYDNAVHTALEKYLDQDFDGDKILNAVDPFPFDRDHDRNGILDNDSESQFELCDSFQIENVKFKPSGPQSGVSKILDNYIVNGCKDHWIQIEGESGYPYAFYDNEWHSTEYKKTEDNLLIYIPCDYCHIRILESESPQIENLYILNKKFSWNRETIKGKIFDKIVFVLYPKKSDCPYDIGCRANTIEHFESNGKDVIGSRNVTKVNYSNLNRFAKMPIDHNDLSIIYTSIKTGKNAVLSLQSEKGEALLIVYGFDELGNLYVADYNNPDNMGKITIKPYTSLIKCDDGYITNSFVEAEGMGISSGDMKICLIG